MNCQCKGKTCQEIAEVIAQYHITLEEIMEVHILKWMEENLPEEEIEELERIYEHTFPLYVLTVPHLRDRFLESRKHLLTTTQKKVLEAFIRGREIKMEILQPPNDWGFGGRVLDTGEKICVWNVFLSKMHEEETFKYDFFIGYVYQVNGKWVASPFAYFIPRLYVAVLDLKKDMHYNLRAIMDLFDKRNFDVLFDGFAPRIYMLKFTIRDLDRFTKLNNRSNILEKEPWEEEWIFIRYTGRLARLIDRNPVRPTERVQIYDKGGNMQLEENDGIYRAIMFFANINLAMAAFKFYEEVIEDLEAFLWEDRKVKEKVDIHEEFQKQKSQDIEEFYRNLGPVSEEEFKFYYNLEERFKYMGAKYVNVEEVLKVLKSH